MEEGKGQPQRRARGRGDGRLIMHYSRSDWMVDRLNRWTWCGRFVPLERVTDRVEAVSCIVCRRGVLLRERARVGGERFRLSVRS